MTGRLTRLVSFGVMVAWWVSALLILPQIGLEGGGMLARRRQRRGDSP